MVVRSILIPYSRTRPFSSREDSPMNASAEATAACGEDGKTRDLFGVCPYVTSQMLLSGKWPI